MNLASGGLVRHNGTIAISGDGKQMFFLLIIDFFESPIFSDKKDFLYRVLQISQVICSDHLEYTVECKKERTPYHRLLI